MSFADESEAVERANASAWGLGGSVWSDPERAYALRSRWIAVQCGSTSMRSSIQRFCLLAPWCPTWATSCVKSGFTSLLSRNSQYRQRLGSTEEATAFDLGQRGFALERLEEKTCLNREVVQIVIFNHTLPRLLTEAQLVDLACERLILKTRFLGIKLRPGIDCHTYHL